MRIWHRKYDHYLPWEDVQFILWNVLGLVGGNSKLESGCQQHSTNLTLMMYGLDLGFICYTSTSIHEQGKNLGGNFRNISLRLVVFF
jgi:hypothetical protein